MAWRATRQYTPISNNEYATDDQLSVRIRDLADGLNNYRYWVLRTVICNTMLYPYAASPEVPSSWTGWNTNERYCLATAPVYVPDCFDSFRVSACHQLIAGSADDVTWKVYSHDRLYTGVKQTFDTSALGAYDFATFESTSTTIAVATDFGGLQRNGEGIAYFTVTGTGAAASCYAALNTLTIVAFNGDA